MYSPVINSGSAYRNMYGSMLRYSPVTSTRARFLPVLSILFQFKPMATTIIAKANKKTECTVSRTQPGISSPATAYTAKSENKRQNDRKANNSPENRAEAGRMTKETQKENSRYGNQTAQSDRTKSDSAISVEYSVKMADAITKWIAVNFRTRRDCGFFEYAAIPMASSEISRTMENKFLKRSPLSGTIFIVWTVPSLPEKVTSSTLRSDLLCPSA
ncbi:hypothetical protein D3C76_475510 [compost metagenome]